MFMPGKFRNIITRRLNSSSIKPPEPKKKEVLNGEDKDSRGTADNQ